jgi:hypothetical protein
MCKGLSDDSVKLLQTLVRTLSEVHSEHEAPAPPERFEVTQRERHL